MSEVKTGYASMSERGRLVCELVELLARHVVLKERANIIPGCSIPKALTKAIAEAVGKLTDDEVAAVRSLRRMCYQISKNGYHMQTWERWEQWRDAHLAKYPADAIQLFILEKTFGITEYRFPTSEPAGYPDSAWKLDHNW